MAVGYRALASAARGRATRTPVPPLVYGLLRQSLGAAAPPSVTTTPSTRRLAWQVVGRTVIFLGITSLLTDISSEMVSAVLPLYLLYQLQVTALQLGIVDGLYQGASGLVRIGAALTADRWQRQKEVASSGYALSAFSRLGLLLVGGVQGVAGFVLVDRFGKGIRTAPRDALISLSVPREQLGLAFGVHRTLDTAGSLIGPLLAFGLLTLAPGAFDAVFVPSFCIGLLGLAVIVLFVNNPERNQSLSAPPDLHACVRLLTLPRFRILVIAGGVLALFTISDAFIYLGLQHRSSLALTYFPLLYVGTALFYLLLALPAGRLADRIGRRRVFLAGQVGMLGIVLLLLAPGPAWLMLPILPVLGAYYALTDGVMMAAASAELGEQLRTSGLALLTTVTALASLASSVALGLLWSTIGMEAAFMVFALGLALAILGSTLGISWSSRRVRFRLAAFGSLALVLVVVSGAYVAVRMRQSQQIAVSPTPTGVSLDAILAQPHVVFLDAPDYSHRHLAVASLDRLDQRYVTDSVCDRVYATTAGGLCLGVEGTVAYLYNARSFDPRLQPRTTFEVQGVPSRVRVSPQAQFASATVFVSGDSYGAPFSTRTFLFDLQSNQLLGNLEDFTVTNQGAPFQSVTFNFWGVTFAHDDRHFYATLGVGDVAGTTYLVQGDMDTHELKVLRENVECPSLSPDGARIAFKKRINDTPGEWRLAILDLSTLQDTLLNDDRSVDDQVEWLDDQHVLYAIADASTPGQLATNIWVATTDGSEQPRVYLAGALSPAVVR